MVCRVSTWHRVAANILQADMRPAHTGMAHMQEVLASDRHGDGEAETCSGLWMARGSSVHAHQATATVQQGPATVARVNGCVRLQTNPSHARTSQHE
eukprot:322561-Chlamydomonas_euryale.AAC.12